MGPLQFDELRHQRSTPCPLARSFQPLNQPHPLSAEDPASCSSKNVRPTLCCDGCESTSGFLPDLQYLKGQGDPLPFQGELPTSVSPTPPSHPRAPRRCAPSATSPCCEYSCLQRRRGSQASPWGTSSPFFHHQNWAPGGAPLEPFLQPSTDKYKASSAIPLSSVTSLAHRRARLFWLY